MSQAQNDQPRTFVSETRAGKARRTIAACVGFLVPGGGQMVRAQPFDALLVFVGVGLSLLWFSVLVTQLVNIHLRFPAGLEPATILDWELVTRFAELRAVPPEIPGLVVLALAIHFFAAYAAWRR